MRIHPSTKIIVLSGNQDRANAVLAEARRVHLEQHGREHHGAVDDPVFPRSSNKPVQTPRTVRTVNSMSALVPGAGNTSSQSSQNDGCMSWLRPGR